MQNVGKYDRVIRLILGCALIAAMLFFKQSIYLGIAGAVFILTSAFSFCPIYKLLKLNTKN